MDRLTLRYRYDASFFDPKLDTDDFGYLSISAEAKGFAGRGGFWVQWQDIKEFAEALSVYPIADQNPVVAQWGYDMQTGDDLMVRMEIASADKRGNLTARFEVADNDDPRNRVRGAFLTTYADVDAFRSSIARMMNNEIEEAVLIGR
ncbi:hypothetical protein [Sphingomonas sp. S-NIH.Pt15_0812]|uniref:hypothetical protein n=1 Tax=Sphingomonas sp. S-NIH.Pt15_0812 TaxID=1920129 RepID=UPI000F7F7BC5|nr:hypothetical protein [Sphingomonas sp. S-NIH.Pt15_0812]RSU46320.1 hypothetical protein BRX43_15770 [Sphingomonas sp. S-NIH.Pt15_0812]